MTGIEKIERILEIKKSARGIGLTYKDADEITELRNGLKVSDWFRYLEDDDTGIEPFYDVFGFTTTYSAKTNKQLEKAIADGYVRMYQTKRYGMWITRIALTTKGKELMH